MSDTEGAAGERCIALTESGDRCQREPDGGRFCHQHDEADRTVDGDAKRTEERQQSDDGDDSTDTVDSLLEVRQTVQAVAAEVIEGPLDGVVELAEDDDGWVATVEVVERRSVPDTQDILGRYELTLDNDGTVVGYRRRARYRRNETGRRDAID